MEVSAYRNARSSRVEGVMIKIGRNPITSCDECGGNHEYIIEIDVSHECMCLCLKCFYELYTKMKPLMPD
jgi:hypothetical protein